MKKTMLTLMVLVAVCLTNVVASGPGNDEVVLKTMTESEIEKVKVNFDNFSQITSIKLVQVSAEKYFKVQGADAQGATLVEWALMPECGECWCRIDGIWRPGVKFGDDCAICAEPAPFPEP